LYAMTIYRLAAGLASGVARIRLRCKRIRQPCDSSARRALNMTVTFACGLHHGGLPGRR